LTTGKQHFQKENSQDYIQSDIDRKMLKKSVKKSVFRLILRGKILIFGKPFFKADCIDFQPENTLLQKWKTR